MNNYFNWYLLIALVIPFIYLLSFFLWKNERKNYKKAFVVSLIMTLFCIGIYTIIFLLIPKSDDKKEIDKTTTTTTTTTTTKFITDYPAPEEIEGEKVYKGKTTKGFDIYTIDDVYYIGGIMIANKTYPLPSSYYPKDTYVDASNVDDTCNKCLVKIAWDAYQDMKNDASEFGLELVNKSGYRSYETQEYLWNRYANIEGESAADTFSSRAGHSDHQTGLAFDLNSIDDSFANTPEGKWVNDNAQRYGFIIRFPKGKQEETGYKYESWHLRYVGEELATTLYNDGNWISLEEYLGITSSYE